MKSVMSHQFSRAPSANIQRSSFDMSHGLKTTFDASMLVPILVQEALPGDTFNLKANFFARMATPIYPVMDNMFLETFFFEVPVRQVWDNWEKFNGEQDNPGDSTDFLIPQTFAPIGGYAEESLEDYMGIPPGVGLIPHSALFSRAYNHIYNTWFRDQNLQTSVVVNKDDGPDLPSDYTLLKRGKRHDYFTSALPWPQKSDAGAVSIPLGTRAPVRTDLITPGVPVGVTIGDSSTKLLNSSGATLQLDAAGASLPETLYADLSEATAATINALRQSIAVQRLFEKDARGGTRYIEVIKQHFQVTSPDLRLQRPGYLGGGRSMVNINAVAQTAQGFATAEDPTASVGKLSGIGTIATTSPHGFTKSFTEHTIIIGICNIRADLTYQQGLDRQYSRRTRFDFFWPELATIGEQTVLRKEIFLSEDANDNDIVFGYQERFAEYRYKNSQICGKFRSSAAESLDAWHLSLDFATAPGLSAGFIQENVPMARVEAVPTEPDFIMDSYFQIKAARPMPMYGIPGLDKL